MKLNVFVRQIIFFLLLLGGNTGRAASDFPETIFDGMQLALQSETSLIYLLPGADLSAYSQVLLEQADIRFIKRWQQEPGADDEARLSGESLERIREQLQSIFADKFSHSLAAGGYQLSQDMSEQVLLLKPSFIDLDIRKLESGAKGDVYAFTEDKAELTLYLELFDAISGQRIAIVYDLKAGRQTGYFLWKDGLSNRAAAERIIALWAESLKRGLDQARLSP